MTINAIILAAGRGTRLQPLTEELPKGLLPIADKPILGYSLDSISAVGIKDVYIVTGFQSEKLMNAIGCKWNGVCIHYVRDSDPVGSMGSLYATRNIPLDGAVVLESDLLYHPSVLQLVVDEPFPNVMLAAPCSGSGDEVYICVDAKKNLVGLGKKLEGKDQAIGELVGITKVSREFLGASHRQYEAESASGVKNRHYEEVFQSVVGNIPMRVLLRSMPWIEIDTQQDYDRAKEQVFPRLALSFSVHEDRQCRQ